LGCRCLLAFRKPCLLVQLSLLTLLPLLALLALLTLLALTLLKLPCLLSLLPLLTRLTLRKLSVVGNGETIASRVDLGSVYTFGPRTGHYRNQIEHLVADERKVLHPVSLNHLPDRCR
jgi:hypothetical protein